MQYRLILRDSASRSIQRGKSISTVDNVSTVEIVGYRSLKKWVNVYGSGP